uniref:Serine kinase n=1 Tax=Dictyoglomus thermophilum TaxID=14 RepID=A0A7C3MK71_DICTH
MKLSEIVRNLELNVIYMDEDYEIRGGIVSDLLSFVMAHAPEDSVWVTIQTHVNTIAVAVLTGIKSIIFVSGQNPDEETIKKAKEEKIALLITKDNAFNVVGKLYSLGIKGVDRLQ